jgi:hypothetical protein
MAATVTILKIDSVDFTEKRVYDRMHFECARWVLGEVLLKIVVYINYDSFRTRVYLTSTKVKFSVGGFWFDMAQIAMYTLIFVLRHVYSDGFE